MPEGKTWYVMRRDIISNAVELWNPRTAETFFFLMDVKKINQGFGAQSTEYDMN